MPRNVTSVLHQELKTIEDVANHMKPYSKSVRRAARKMLSSDEDKVKPIRNDVNSGPKHNTMVISLERGASFSRPTPTLTFLNRLLNKMRSLSYTRK